MGVPILYYDGSRLASSKVVKLQACKGSMATTTGEGLEKREGGREGGGIYRLIGVEVSRFT